MLSQNSLFIRASFFFAAGQETRQRRRGCYVRSLPSQQCLSKRTLRFLAAGLSLLHEIRTRVARKIRKHIYDLIRIA